MNNEMNIFLESYLYYDGKSKLKYEALTEGEKKVFTKSLVKKLFDSIKNKSLKVDYMGLERTNGILKNYPKYSDIENAVKILHNMYLSDPNIAPDEILGCVKVLDILNKYSADFNKSFKSRNQAVILLYVNMSAALISGISKLIYTTIEYVKQPNGNYKMIFKENSKNLIDGKDPYFESFNRFIKMDRNGQLKKLFDSNTNDVLKEDGFDILTDMPDSIKDLGKTAGIVFIVVGAIFVISKLPYLYYCARRKLSSHLLNIAYFIEEHTEEIDTSTKRGESAKQKQLKIVEKLKSLGEALSLDDKKSKKDAEKDKKKDDDEIKKDQQQNTSSDDDILL